MRNSRLFQITLFVDLQGKYSKASTVQIWNSIDNENVIFSSKEVLKELVPLRDTNDSGPDNISAFLLKRCSSLLLTPCAIYLLYLCGEEFTPIFGKKVLRFLFINREM